MDAGGGLPQTNRKIDTGKTLTRWPVFVDHFTRNCISLVLGKFFTQKSLTRLVLTMNVEGMLSEIDTNKCDVLYDGLSVKGFTLTAYCC